MDLNVLTQQWRIVEELKPLVRALNCMREAVDLASDNWEAQLPDPDDRIQDTDHDESVRELSLELEQELFTQANRIANDYGMHIIWNRLEARFVLQENQP